MMNTAKLQQMIANRRDQIAVLFKRYKIKQAPGIDGIMLGYNKFGQRFIMDLYQILGSPAQVEAGSGFMIEDPTLVPAGEATGSSGGSTNVWGFLGELITAASQGWQTWQQNQNPSLVLGQQNYQLEYAKSQLDTNKILIYGLGAAVLILVLVMFLKK